MHPQEKQISAGPLPDWRRAWRERDARTGDKVARIRERLADFQVHEVLDYEFSGDGEHDYLLLEKQGANTTWVARQLAAYAGISARDVGYAGQKDRYSVSQQWFSVRRPAGSTADWSAFEQPGLRVIECARHRRKLRRGAHRANDFQIVLRGMAADDGAVAARLRQIREQGVPNYFGEQRFGRAGGNLALARSLFVGRRLPRQQRSMALSAARAFLFNHILEQRLLQGSWNRLLPGDCASLDGSGSIFPVTEPDAELMLRVRQLDLHPSGALWGKGTSACEGSVAALEQQVADRFADLSAGLERFAELGRRPLRLVVRELTWEWREDTLRLAFSLGRGGFATAVLREIAAYEVSSST